MLDLLIDVIRKDEMIDLITPHLNQLNIDKIKARDSKETIIKYFKRANRLKIINKKDLYELFGERLALHPVDLEERLNISKTERKRWTEEGKLKVARTEIFTKYRQDFECPYYDYKQATTLKQSKIEKWREQHKLQVAKNRSKGAKKAIKTKDKNKELVKNFYEKELVEMKQKWNSVDQELFVTYNLAFWTMWVSRMAKQFQEKAVNAKTKGQEYTEKKNEFYQMKNRAMDLLSKSKYSKIEFYRPERHEKIYVSFCDLHYHDWCRQREWCYMSKWDYYYDNRGAVHRCKECEVVVDKDYYSLYYLKIQCDNVPDITFSFHTPYPVSKVNFPDPKKLERVEHEENEEGLFRFGRALVGEEVVVFTESRVRKYIAEALNLFEKSLEDKKEDYDIDVECYKVS